MDTSSHRHNISLLLLFCHVVLLIMAQIEGVSPWLTDIPDNLTTYRGCTVDIPWSYNETSRDVKGLAIIKTGVPPITFISKDGNDTAMMKQADIDFIENSGVRLYTVTAEHNGTYEVRVIFQNDLPHLYDMVHLHVNELSSMQSPELTSLQCSSVNCVSKREGVDEYSVTGAIPLNITGYIVLADNKFCDQLTLELQINTSDCSADFQCRNQSCDFILTHCTVSQNVTLEVIVSTVNFIPGNTYIFPSIQINIDVKEAVFRQTSLVVHIIVTLIGGTTLLCILICLTHYITYSCRKASTETGHVMMTQTEEERTYYRASSLICPEDPPISEYFISPELPLNKTSQPRESYKPTDLHNIPFIDDDEDASLITS